MSEPKHFLNNIHCSDVFTVELYSFNDKSLHGDFCSLITLESKRDRKEAEGSGLDLLYSWHQQQEQLSV